MGRRASSGIGELAERVGVALPRLCILGIRDRAPTGDRGPDVILDPTRDSLGPPEPIETHRNHFTQIADHVCVPTGHNLLQEAPAAVVDAVVALRF
jgi:hypothetical protein